MITRTAENGPTSSPGRTAFFLSRPRPLWFTNGLVSFTCTLPIPSTNQRVAFFPTFSINQSACGFLSLHTPSTNQRVDFFPYPLHLPISVRLGLVQPLLYLIHLPINVRLSFSPLLYWLHLPIRVWLLSHLHFTDSINQSALSFLPYPLHLPIRVRLSFPT